MHQVQLQPRQLHHIQRVVSVEGGFHRHLRRPGNRAEMLLQRDPIPAELPLLALLTVRFQYAHPITPFVYVDSEI